MDATEKDGEELPAELIIKLDPAIELKGAKYDELKLREPRASEVRQAEGHLRSSVNVESMRRYQLALISAVTGWNLAVVECLPISKVREASDYLQRFIEGGPVTGKN